MPFVLCCRLANTNEENDSAFYQITLIFDFLIIIIIGAVGVKSRGNMTWVHQ